MRRVGLVVVLMARCFFTPAGMGLLIESLTPTASGVGVGRKMGFGLRRDCWRGGETTR